MTTKGAGFVKGVKDSSGNYRPAGSNQGGSKVEELSSHEDLEEAQLSRDEVVVELEQGGKIRELDPDERFIKVKTDSLGDSRLEKWFSDEEIAELESKESVVTGEEGPSDYDEAMEGMRRDIEKFNEALAREKRAKEIEQAKEELKKGTKYDRDVSSLSGEEFKELIAEANQNPNSDPKSEELEAAIDQINQKYAPMLGDSEPEINNVQIEELEEGTEAWRERAEEEEGKSYWEEMAQDVEASNELPNTEITTLSNGETKLVKTSYDKLKKELQQVDQNPDKDGKIVEKNGGVITARVSEGDKFQ